METSWMGNVAREENGKTNQSVADILRGMYPHHLKDLDKDLR
jgi:hypothetical protein